MPRTGARASCRASFQGTALNAAGRADRQPGPRRRHDRRPSSGPSSTCSNRLNRRQLEQHPGEAELAARIESFELAYRMQMAAPEALDVDSEPEAIAEALRPRQPEVHALRQAVPDRPAAGRARRALRADLLRRHGERAELGRPHRTSPTTTASSPARPTCRSPACSTDLKQRGLLDSTLVIWGGEFGRLPIVQKGGTGRDHNPHAFTTWMAGGGVKGGVHHGETDEFGHKAVVDRVSINDLHATILHLLGIDHKRLTYRFNGRDFRLTDVAGEVVREILA